MKIEFKIDDKNIELQQKDINTTKSIPLHDTEILRKEFVGIKEQ